MDAWGVLGVLSACAAVWVALAATRLRRRGEGLRESLPQSIDGAVRELERGLRPGPGVYSGRLGAEGEVTSPGGVVCAFYEATVRDVASGAGLVEERGAAPRVWIRGERAHAAVAFSARSAHAAAEERRCLVERDGPRAALSVAGGGASALSAPGALEAISTERVGRIGHSCFVLGRLERAPSGGYVVRGVGGGPAEVISGVSHAALAREWLARSWGLFAAAATLLCAAAWLLSR